MNLDWYIDWSKEILIRFIDRNYKDNFILYNIECWGDKGMVYVKKFATGMTFVSLRPEPDGNSIADNKEKLKAI